MISRPYNPETDQAAGERIWREVGWTVTTKNLNAMAVFLSSSRVLVADLNGEPECLAASTPGTFRYLNEDLKLSAVTGVTTSRIARKQGLAGRLTAELIAMDAQEGAQVSVLGIFEQGYYNRLGFGNGACRHYLSFDPAQLIIPHSFRVPCRLTQADWQTIHHALLNRWRRHGACNLEPATHTQAELAWTENSFGLGYTDGPNGELTHFFWAETKKEHGPYVIKMMAYQNGGQFLELMALLQSLGDQIHAVHMIEPPAIQMQDLIHQPRKSEIITKRSTFETFNQAAPDWQTRMCNLESCLAQTHLRRPSVRFNLDLHDPIEDFLPTDAPWRGLTGSYTITLGEHSKAKKGHEAGLFTLTASVGAFTRLWLGVRPATSLAITDTLAGPSSLLEALDETLCLPEPQVDWEF